MSKSKLLPFLPLYFLIFFGFFGYSLMITIFTPLFLKHNAFSFLQGSSQSFRTILLGFVLFLYPFGQFLSSPILGAFSDRFGRKPLLLLSLGITTICYALIAFTLTLGLLVPLLIVLFVAGLADGNVVIAQSTIADKTNYADRSRYFGYIYMSASLAYMIGPLLGGKIASPELMPWFNNALPFWVASLLLFFTFLWFLFFFRETHLQDKRAIIKYFDAITNVKNIFFSKFRFLFLINFLLYTAIFGFFRSYPMYIVDEFHVTVSKLSEYIAWVAVPIVSVNLFLTNILFSNFTPLKLTIFSAFGIFLMLEALVIFNSQEALWITLFFSGLVIAIALTSCPTFLSRQAPGDEQGRVMGNNQSLQFFAEASSGIIGGLLAAVFVKFSLIILGLISLLASFLLVARYWYRMRSAK